MLGAVAVVFGIAWLLDTLHVAHISVEAAVAAALMVLGAAMIVTGRTDWSLSRRAWPVFAGVGLILVLIATSTTFGVVSGSGMASFGNRSVTIRTPGQTVQGGFGNMNVDASGLTAGGSLTIANVAGVVRVSLPEGVAAHIDARILAGQVCIAGQNAGNGVDVNAHRDLAGTSGSTSGPAVSLNVHEVSGEVLIGAGGCSG